MDISLINVNGSYKRVTSAHFSELLRCLLLLKNNPYAKEAHVGVSSSAPSRKDRLPQTGLCCQGAVGYCEILHLVAQLEGGSTMDFQRVVHREPSPQVLVLHSNRLC